jgi:hypothetical protein
VEELTPLLATGESNESCKKIQEWIAATCESINETFEGRCAILIQQRLSSNSSVTNHSRSGVVVFTDIGVGTQGI